MNQVKTYIDKSQIEGIGLFAAEFISAGTLIWKFDGLDQMLTVEFVNSLSDHQRKYFERYMFEKNGLYCFCPDDAKYANHSNDSNTISTFERQYAKRDIQVGEEITCDYRDINDEFSETEFETLKSYKQ
jgi:SET domain-containing protein